MSKRLTGLNPLAYIGVEALTPPQLYIADRAPTIGDSKNFNLSDMWLDRIGESLYVLVSLAAGEATWVTTFGGAANNFETDNGTATDSNGTISILGNGITTETEATSAHTVTVRLTEGNDGQLIIGDSNAPAEWATVTSSDNTINIVAGPHSLGLTANTSAIVGNGTNGQLLIGGGTAPEWASLTSDGSIVITAGVNTLEITAPNATGLTTVHSDSGTATQASGAITLAGNTINTITSATGSTVTVGVKNGTNGQLLIGGGSNATWANLTSTGASVVITNGANSINLEATGTGAGASSFHTDSTTATEAAGVIALLGINNITTVGSGNTVAFSVSGTTNNAVQVGNSSSSLSSLAVGTNGQVLIGSTGANPQFSTLTSTGGTVTFTPGAGTLNLEAVGGSGSGSVIVNDYTAPGSYAWVKSPLCKYVEVYGWNGGGGGGGGGQGSTVGNGGSGGAGGSAFYLYGPAALFDSNEDVEVGSGGSGGLGAIAANTVGSNGSAGGQSRFGDALVPLTMSGNTAIVTGNNYGLGGSVNANAVTKGGGYAGLFSMMNGNIYDFFPGSASSSVTNKVPYGGGGGSASFSNGSDAGNGGSEGSSNFFVFTFMLPTGGGGGSPWNTNGLFNNPGGNGGNYIGWDGTTVIGTGGLGGQNAGAPDGSDGPSLPSSGGMIYGGLGGGGGKGRFGTSTPGNGGDGGLPGGGGGGGGGAASGVVGGNGGAGGSGRVIVIQWT